VRADNGETRARRARSEMTFASFRVVGLNIAAITVSPSMVAGAILHRPQNFY